MYCINKLMNERSQSLAKDKDKRTDKLKDVYIYSTVNIDNCFAQVTSRSRKIKEALDSAKLPL